MTRRLPILPAVAPLLLSAAMTLVCLCAAGSSQGVFFGGVAFAVLITAPIAAAEQTLRGRTIVTCAVVAGTSLVWLLAARDPYVTWRHWLGATAVVACVVISVGGIAAALRATRLPAPLAAALTTLLFAAWLTWPIWLSPHVAGREDLVGTLSTPHPLLALDGFLSDLGPPWPERTLMYRDLSILNQDVAYESPGTIAWAMVLHLVIAAAGEGLAALRTRRAARANVIVAS